MSAARAEFVVVQNLRKAFGGLSAIEDVSFSVAEGGTLALLGPSGCGKTTILRCLAGLEGPDGGFIGIGGESVFDARHGIDVAPERRQLGIVFQSYAVWPHMTVAENVAFPLKVRGVPRAERRERARHMLAVVGLGGLEDRPSTQVSGGQQQRVALARALVHEPRLVLFDEALSNLDAQLREQMRIELKALQDRLGFTAIYVTHDQGEAFGLAERVVLMNRGRVETSGVAKDVFHRPSSPFVAEFLGLNVHRGEVVDLTSEDAAAERYAEIAFGDGLSIWARVAERGALHRGDKAVACMRKEHVRFCAAGGRAVARGSAAEPAVHAGVIATASFLGLHEEYLLDVGGVRFRSVQPWSGASAGDAVAVSFDPKECMAFRDGDHD
jgi:ABC-type Fe3+/spermidine/putrescine transport system ATPase subunit